MPPLSQLSCQPCTSGARVWFQASSRFLMGTSSTGTGFFQITPCQCHSTSAPYWFVHHWHYIMLAADSIITLLCCCIRAVGRSVGRRLEEACAAAAAVSNIWRYVYFSLKVNVPFRLLHNFNNKIKTCYNFLDVAFVDIFIENILN